MKNLERILSNQKQEIEAVQAASLCSRKEERDVQLDSSLAQVVIGVRRSGKSTLCKKVLIMSGVTFAYVNFDDEQLAKATGDDLDDIYQMLYTVYGNFTHLFLDEIQNVREWPLFVNRLLRQGMHLILTGSNANLLSGDLATHLTGRYHLIELFPFSFAEYCVAQNVDTVHCTTQAYGLRNRALMQYMMEGGFPELTLSPDMNKRDYLMSLKQAIIIKDICRRYRVRYQQTISRLAAQALDWFGQEKSYTDISKELGIRSVHTTMNYFAYLQNAYVVCLLSRFSLKSTERNSFHKAYAVDNAFLSQHENALQTENYGLRLENVVAVELMRRLNREYEQLYYLRGRDYEVDFVVVENFHVRELVQVTYDFVEPTAKLFNREVDALVKASQQTGCDNLTLVVMMGEPQEIQRGGKTIHCVQATEWLLGQ